MSIASSSKTTVALLLLGTGPEVTDVNDSLDADFIIPAAQGFPDLPAGKAPDGTIKLAMDCEGIVFNCDGTFFISDEYGRTTLHFIAHQISIRVPLQSNRNFNRCIRSSRSVHPDAKRDRILLRRFPASFRSHRRRHPRKPQNRSPE